MTELKKCPFCGGEVYITYSSGLNLFNIWHYGHGHKCPFAEPFIILGDYAKSLDDAAEIWNRRDRILCPTLMSVASGGENEKAQSEYDRGYAEGMKDGINEMKNNLKAQYEIGYTQGQIDVIRHGEWVRKESETAYWFECSECGEEPLRDGYGRRKFSRHCPSCGALMERRKQNDTKRA